MTYFLDTNICIYYLNNSNPNLSKKLKKMPTTSIQIPSIVAAELLYGAEKSVKRENNIQLINTFLSVFEIINFDEKAAGYYAAIRAELERRGQMIGSNDIIIAATTLACNATLVTHNTGEFSRIKKLKIEDWTA
ncbi:MAG: type II toxin-antitoxin system VapC family toxin [Treponema sp.]|nr:type II toxin-antitoxin system VapC family toxin [Treponema sp.]